MKKLILAAMGLILSASSWAATPTFADRVEETTGTTGTGTVSLAGATTKNRTFVAGVGNGNQTYYLIIHANKPEWEIGIGTVTDGTPDTLSRDTVTIGTNGAAKVDFSAGTKYVSVEITSALITSLGGGGGGTVTAVTASAPLASSGGATPNISISSSTGTGAVVQANTPTLITPVLGVATATTVNKVAVTAPATGSTLTIQDGFTLTANGNATVSGTNTGDQTITLTGDVTGSGTGSFAATIANDAVTYAKMQNISATSKVLGRKTAGAGDTEEVTLSELLDFIGSAAQGDLLFRGAAGWQRLGTGTSGYFLKAQGAGADLVWAAVPGGGDALTSNPLSQFAATTSAQFMGVITNETGTGLVVANDSPTLITPVLGVASATSINKVAITAPATGSTLTIQDGFTLTVSGSATISASFSGSAADITSGTLAVARGGTGITSLGTGMATWWGTPSSANLASTVTDETGSGALVFATSPTLTTPILGTPTSGTLTNCTSLPIGAGTTGTLAVDRGGTGQTTYTDGQLLIGNTTGNTLTKTTLTAGSNITITNGSGSITIAASGGSGVTKFVPGGRLSLTSATPVTTSNVTSATTIYYALYLHDQIPIYDGSSWTPTTFTELTNDTTASSTNKAGPAAVTTNSNYDLFVWSDSGTIRLTRGPLWTSDTGRGTGAGTTELERVNGILVNKIAITNGPAAQKGTYVGTVRSDGSSQINDSDSRRCVWNMYNRVKRFMTCKDTTDNWSTTSTWRAANGSTTVGTARVEVVFGLAEDSVHAINKSATAVSSYSAVGIGISSTSTNSAQMYGGFATTSAFGDFVADYVGIPGLGYYYIQRLENANGGASTTFYGDSGSTSYQSAMNVETTQ